MIYVYAHPSQTQCLEHILKRPAVHLVVYNGVGLVVIVFGGRLL